MIRRIADAVISHAHAVLCVLAGREFGVRDPGSECPSLCTNQLTLRSPSNRHVQVPSRPKRLQDWVAA